jgi:hypothetical protein
MKKLYIDQIARRITDYKYSTKTYFNSDIDQATAAMQWIIDYLAKDLDKCNNVVDGKCTVEWKHEDCERLSRIINDLKTS